MIHLWLRRKAPARAVTRYVDLSGLRLLDSGPSFVRAQYIYVMEGLLACIQSSLRERDFHVEALAFLRRH